MGIRRAKYALAGLAVTVVAAGFPQTADAGSDHRCYLAKAGKRKTSLGVHQWTVRQESRWCAERRDGRWRITSITRRVSVRTGTNWKLVSRSGGISRSGSRAIAESGFHLRLRYPYFEQNCYPRIEIRMLASGESERAVRTGC